MLRREAGGQERICPTMNRSCVRIPVGVPCVGVGWIDHSADILLRTSPAVYSKWARQSRLEAKANRMRVWTQPCGGTTTMTLDRGVWWCMLFHDRAPRVWNWGYVRAPTFPAIALLIVMLLPLVFESSP